MRAERGVHLLRKGLRISLSCANVGIRQLVVAPEPVADVSYLVDAKANTHTGVQEQLVSCALPPLTIAKVARRMVLVELDKVKQRMGHGSL